MISKIFETIRERESMMFGETVVSLLATYNSFRNQIGYCRMQSFNTTSRSSSGSVPMFLDGRVSFGVGLSSLNMDESDAFLCGMCVNVTHADNFFAWNDEITLWKERADYWFIAMVMDRCADPVCTENFLDFDIYSPTQPVHKGNPSFVHWHPVPCPVSSEETIEYLICTPDTCNLNSTTDHIPPQRRVHYWSLSIRNSRLPLKNVSVILNETRHDLKRSNAWVWDYTIFDLDIPFEIQMIDVSDRTHTDIISVPSHGSASYHGGYLISSSIQT